MPSDFLLYGSNGLLGEVITRAATKCGLKPVVAGRNAAKVKALADELGLDHRVFSLDDSDGMDRALGDAVVVLHCAGPYVHTAKLMVDGCLRTVVN